MMNPGQNSTTDGSPGAQPDRVEVYQPSAEGRQPYALAASGKAAEAPRSVAGESKPHTTKAPPPGRVLAETVVAAVVDRFAAAADRRGGALTATDVRAVGDEVRSKMQALEIVFQQSLEEYARTRERSAIIESRHAPFERLVVKRFAHLIGTGPEQISRRMLPGFFQVLNLMLGGDKVAAFEQTCVSIVDRMREERGISFSWDEFYGDAEANAVAASALAAMTLHFEDPAKRRHWFIDVINSHLVAAPDGDPDTNWQLSDETLEALLQVLFDDVRGALQTETGRNKITEDHGADIHDRLSEILDRV